MRRRPAYLAAIAVLAGASLALTSGCGSDDSDDDSGASTTVNGCEIAPGTQCQNADLSGVELNGDDAQGGDFSGADFSGAQLSGVNLSRANLTMANLEDATLTDVDLSSANLTQANLTGGTLTGVNLDGTVLCGTTRTDGTIDDSSCPPSGGTTTQSTTTEATTTDATTTEGTTTSGTTTSAGGAPRFVSFDAPSSATCGEGDSQTTVSVSWDAENTTGISIAVDGEAPGAQAGFGASGTANVEVPCDGEDHEVSVTAFNAEDETATETATVSTS